MNQQLQEAAKAYAEEKFPYIWPLNKEGERVTLLVGQKNPPGSAKARRQQEAHIQTFLAGVAYIQAQSAGVWVNPHIRIPEYDGYDEPTRYICRIKCDDPRSGWVWVGQMTREEIETEGKKEEYMEWFDEFRR